ncbi:hypothetical protein ACP4OV_021289 [Aristida adscensionis]
MGHHHFGWFPMDPAASAALAGAMPLPSTATPAANGAAYCVDPTAYASVLPQMMQPVPAAEATEAARRRQEEEEGAAIRLVHLLVTCAGAIQEGDYSAAHGTLADARGVLCAISTASGIGRLAEHFAAALAHRLFPATPHSPPPPPPLAAPAELHYRFYEAAPFLKFAHFAANQAILEAFDGCPKVHVVDFAIMHGHQWPALIHALAKRDGGPPHLRITGVGPPSTGGGDELREVGFRLAELARSLNVEFMFQGVSADKLDEVFPWKLRLATDEQVAVNSVLQLHRLLVDRDADPAVRAPIDAFLEWVAAIRPKVFTVVEQEVDHNKPLLQERFTNALFHYAAMFDSMEALSSRAVGAGRALAEAYLQSEIFDIVCGEGSARAERHEPLGRWRERLAGAGLTQVPFGPSAVHHATGVLRSLTSSSSSSSSSASGFGVWERDGSLALAWHGRPLYSATAWRATGGNAAGGATRARHDDNGYMHIISRDGSAESNGSGNLATAQDAAQADGMII